MLKSRKSRSISPAPEEQGYNSSDVARMCGVSLRQLQWWDERSVVSPRQDGHKRVYSPAEVVFPVRVLGRMGIKVIVMTGVDPTDAALSAPPPLPR